MIGLNIGLPGSSGSASSEEDMSSLVYRPGGTASAGVVTSWAGVHSFATAAKAPWVLLVDASLSTPAEVPAGADTDFRGLVTIYAGTTPFNYYDLTIRDTGKIRNVAEFKYGTVLVEAFTTPGIYAANGVTTFSEGAGLTSEVTATVAAFSVTANHIMMLNGASPMFPQAIGVPLILYANGTDNQIHISNNGSGDDPIYANTLQGDSTGSLYVVMDASSSLPSQASTYLGTIGKARSDHSQLLDWSAGDTANRPANPVVGQTYFDTTLARPIWWSGSAWVNHAGASV